MPLYEYACRTCDHTFEALTRAGSKESVACPACAGTEIDRLIGLPAAPPAAKPATNCRGDGPPCGAPMCGRRRPPA